MPDFPPHIGTKSWVRVNSFQTPVRYANLGAQVVQELADDIGSVVVVVHHQASHRSITGHACNLAGVGHLPWRFLLYGPPRSPYGPARPGLGGLL